MQQPQEVPVEQAELLDRARALHARMPVIDLHSHFLLSATIFRRRFHEAHTPRRWPKPFRSSIDLPRLLEGGVSGQVFTVYVPGKPLFFANRERADKQLDLYERIVRACDGAVAPCTTAAEFEAARAAGRFASFAAIEGCHHLDGDVDALDHFFARGVRLMQLTHFVATDVADSAQSPYRPHGGLSKLGERVVLRMNRLGLVVDVAHMTDPGIARVADVAQAPFVCSHAGVRALRDLERSLSTESVDLIAKSGGLVGVILFPMLLAKGGATVDTVVDHLAWLADRVGPEHLGIGSDLDGPTWAPEGLRDVRDFPVLTARMLARGFSEADVAGIWGGNFLRVLDAAAGAARAASA
jgi:membrane dipeptidase